MIKPLQLSRFCLPKAQYVMHASSSKVHSRTFTASCMLLKVKESQSRQYIKKGPGLEYFIYNRTSTADTNIKTQLPQDKHPYVHQDALDGHGLKGSLRTCSECQYGFWN